MKLSIVSSLSLSGCQWSTPLPPLLPITLTASITWPPTQRYIYITNVCVYCTG